MYVTSCRSNPKWATNNTQKNGTHANKDTKIKSKKDKSNSNQPELDTEMIYPMF